MKQRFKTPSPPGTQAVVRAIAILKSLAKPPHSYGITELAVELDINKAAVFRLLGALESEGMVVRDESTASYRLGPELISLGASALGSTDLSTVAHDALIELVRQTGETATLEILVGSEVLLISEVQGHFVLAGHPEMGMRWPSNATATGKVLTAMSQSAPPPTELRKRTSRTITSRHEMDRELDKVRGQGYATATDELEVGFTAIAAPIRNHTGSVVAAISLNGPTSRIHGAAMREMITVLREAADDVSRRLGASTEMLSLHAKPVVPRKRRAASVAH
ncbi:MAG: IclR family transcriptional regulator [Gemmatimonadaceae bacterium]